jgi:hypothetical protein
MGRGYARVTSPIKSGTKKEQKSILRTGIKHGTKQASASEGQARYGREPDGG